MVGLPGQLTEEPTTHNTRAPPLEGCAGAMLGAARGARAGSRYCCTRDCFGRNPLGLCHEPMSGSLTLIMGGLRRLEGGGVYVPPLFMP